MLRLLAASLLTMLPLPLFARDASAYPRVLVPERGAYFGSWVAPRGGEDGFDPIRRVEMAIGRKFAVDHQYYRWDQPLPTQHENATYRRGRLPFVNWCAMRVNGSTVPWAEIADGSKDGWIAEQARRFRAFDHPIYLAFHHEPENDSEFGTPASYAAAFRQIVQVFRAEGVDNVAFVWTMMSWTYDRDSGRDPYDWYPGDQYVDIVGSDGYNWAPGKAGAPWESFETIFAPTVAFARARDKPAFAVEYGVQEDPNNPGRKAEWFRQALRTASKWPRMKALIYYDEVKDSYPWITDSSSSSMSAYAGLGGARWLSPTARG